jgi:hypothetical protein
MFALLAARVRGGDAGIFAAHLCDIGRARLLGDQIAGNRRRGSRH